MDETLSSLPQKLQLKLTFPFLGGLGDIVTNFFGRQTQWTDLGGQSGSGCDLSSDCTKADDLLNEKSKSLWVRFFLINLVLIGVNYFLRKQSTSERATYCNRKNLLWSLTCSWHQKTKSRILQFPNLKCCIKTSLLKPLFNGVSFLIKWAITPIGEFVVSFFDVMNRLLARIL